jgi:hypothetical protein
MLACFGFGAIEHFLIWLVVFVAILAIVRVVISLASVPSEFAWLVGAVVQVIRIVLWAAVIIAVIVLVFGLLACIVPLR